jgi:hypothetical protein
MGEVIDTDVIDLILKEIKDHCNEINRKSKVLKNMYIRQKEYLTEMHPETFRMKKSRRAR